MSIFMVLLLSVTLVSAGNVTMQAGDFNIDGDLTIASGKVGVGTTSPGYAWKLRVGMSDLPLAVGQGFT